MMKMLRQWLSSPSWRSKQSYRARLSQRVGWVDWSQEESILQRQPWYLDERRRSPHLELFSVGQRLA